MTKEADTAFRLGKMVKNIKVSGRMIKDMEKVY